MVVSDVILVMLLTNPKWQSFTTREITATKKTALAPLCLSRDSKDEGNQSVECGAVDGGTSDPNPPQDYGYYPSGKVGQVRKVEFTVASIPCIGISRRSMKCSR